MTPLEKETHIAHRSHIRFVRGQFADARTKAAMNVVLQTGMRMLSIQIDLAGRHFEVPMNKVNQPVRQIPREVGAVVGRSVSENAACDVDAGITFVRQPDVRIGFVISKQDVKAGLVLLDQVVFERKCLFIVVDLYEVDVMRFGNETSRLGFRQPIFIEITPDAAAKILGFADVENRSLCILVEVNTRLNRKLRYFLA